MARIKHRGKMIHLGTYDTVVEAWGSPSWCATSHSVQRCRITSILIRQKGIGDVGQQAAPAGRSVACRRGGAPTRDKDQPEMSERKHGGDVCGDFYDGRDVPADPVARRPCGPRRRDLRPGTEAAGLARA
jgi:hypothetical protein